MISKALCAKHVLAVLLFVVCAAASASPLYGDTPVPELQPRNAAQASSGKVPFPRPGSHKGKWIEYHGSQVLAEGNSTVKTGKTCGICHDKIDCITCHETRMPRDHTNYWRTRSHGFMAEGNRQRCMTCHRQDFCIRCHMETAPRTHTATWTTRHCTWCHYGSGFAPESNCVVCHKTALHTSAPHTVNGSMNCSLCHH
ncbi:MAG TPA: hypothetical protein VK654_01020 [Nitrospirota bacterium]|nr:hypothetical protein [Nitrospirota bacterium]